MIKKEKINILDNSIEPLGAGKNGVVVRLSDGRVAKFLNPFSIRCYKIFNSSLEEKLERCQEVKDIKELVLPETAIVMDGTTIGYTMEYNEGITFNKYYDQKTEEDHNNLHKELEMQRKINDIVKKCNERGLVFPDLLTCDNIMIDKNGNVSLLDIDGMQVLDTPALTISTTLGEDDRYGKLKKYSLNPEKNLYTSELDKKSLTYLLFLAVFNCNLEKIGSPTGRKNELVTLDYMFKYVGLDYEKAKRIVSDNISDTVKGQYLDNLYNILENRYDLKAEQLSEEVKLAYMMYNPGVSREFADSIREKKLVRKK